MNNNLLPYVLGALSTATLAMALFISVDPAQALYLPHCFGCSLGQHLELILEQYGTPVHAATFHRTDDGDAVSVLHAQDVDPYLSGFAAR